MHQQTPPPPLQELTRMHQQNQQLQDEAATLRVRLTEEQETIWRLQVGALALAAAMLPMRAVPGWQRVSSQASQALASHRDPP